MPREVFIAGQILTAAEMNTVSDQTVMSFAGTAARGSAIPTPVEGMVTYLNDADRLEVYTNAWKPVGGVLQVVSTTKTDTFSTSSTSYVDITGLSVSITPVSVGSKILVMASLYGDTSVGNIGMIQLVRNSTAVAIGDASSNRVRATTGVGTFEANRPNSGSVQFLDSPATTSATTYKLQMRTASGTVYLNRSSADNDDSAHPRASSTITLMEIAG
jgi:hypothetical protein